MAEVLPLTRSAFVIAAITGLGMFVTRAPQYVQMTPFLLKFVFMGIALVNIWVFHAITIRDIEIWDTAAKLPNKVKFAGGSSLLLWVGVVAFGRWIGFV